MRKLLVFILVSICIQFSMGQSIGDFFKMLPDKVIYNIPKDKRDSILMGKKYYDPENDSNSIMYYQLEESSDDYLRISMAFETGQAASVDIEMRRYKAKNGKMVIVLSEAGGAHQMQWQNEIDVFEYSKNKLEISDNWKLPDSIPFSAFFKTATPDNILKEYNKEYNFSYELGGDAITYRIAIPEYKDMNHTLKNWIQYNVIVFDWIDDKFKQKKILEDTYTY